MGVRQPVAKTHRPVEARRAMGARQSLTGRKRARGSSSMMITAPRTGEITQLVPSCIGAEVLRNDQQWDFFSVSAVLWDGVGLNHGSLFSAT